MVVSGLPVDRRDHARALALLALGLCLWGLCLFFVFCGVFVSGLHVDRTDHVSALAYLFRLCLFTFVVFVAFSFLRFLFGFGFLTGEIMHVACTGSVLCVLYLFSVLFFKIFVLFSKF
jgi:hypothetical protein